MTWTTLPRSSWGALAAYRAGADPQAPQVVLLHGVGLRAEAWGAQIPALVAAGYEVIAPDMPGHGETPPWQALGPTLGKVEAPTLTDYIAVLRDAIQQSPVPQSPVPQNPAPDSPKPVALVGHSMGAMLALGLASALPQSVACVVAMNAVFQRDAQAQQAVQQRAARLDGVSLPDPSPTLERWFGDSASPERAACQQWLAAVDPSSYAQAYGVFAHSTQPSPTTLAQLACPALFMTGAQEPNSTPAMSQAMAQLSAEGQALVIDGAAHMMPMTHADRVNAALLDFLARHFA